MQVVPITEDNYADVAAIYAASINTGNATFETTVPSYEQWLLSHLSYAGIAVIESSKILGWAAFSAVTGSCVYQGVAEVSVYVSATAQGTGVGSFLLTALIRISEENELWTLQSNMMRENIASKALHIKHGFREIGYREKIGKLDGEWRDNIVFEKRSKKIGVA
jgi:phosphinothricin acetyltransferase